MLIFGRCAVRKREGRRETARKPSPNCILPYLRKSLACSAPADRDVMAVTLVSRGWAMILFLGWFPSAGSAEQRGHCSTAHLPPPAAPGTQGLLPLGPAPVTVARAGGGYASLPLLATLRGEGLLTSPVTHRELARIKSFLCRIISEMFWELELHIKNIQQYTIVFAFSKASILVWNIISHIYSSKNPYVFNWGWNFLMIWFQRYFKSWSWGRQRNLSFFLFLLFYFFLFPFSFFLFPSTLIFFLFTETIYLNHCGFLKCFSDLSCHFDWNKKSFAGDGLHAARWCKKGGNKNKWQQIYEVLPCKFMWRTIKAVLRVYLCGWTLIHDRATKVPFPLLEQELSEL